MALKWMQNLSKIIRYHAVNFVLDANSLRVSDQLSFPSAFPHVKVNFNMSDHLSGVA
jgi:hypothetical protein